MLKQLLTAVFILAVLGLLTTQRFLMQPELSVSVVELNGSSSYEVGDRVPRGSIIDTGEEFLEIVIGSDIHVWLSRNTRLELHRLFDDELTLRLKRGRVLVSNQSEAPLLIETNHTSHLLYQDIASIVNYDFLETIHVVPLEGSVQVQTDTSNGALSTPVALSIHETDPVSIEQIGVNLEAGSDWDFYEWTGQIE